MGRFRWGRGSNSSETLVTVSAAKPRRFGASGKTGWPRLKAAFRNSCAGLQFVWRSEEAFRHEVWMFVLLSPLGWYLADDPVERILLIGSLALVLIVELLNTAIEVVVDRIGFDRHELSGHAKDLGSAAVLLSFALAALVWTVVLNHR